MTDVVSVATAKSRPIERMWHQTATPRVPVFTHGNPSIQEILQNRTQSDPVVMELRSTRSQIPRAQGLPPSAKVASEIKNFLATEFWTHLHASCPTCHHWHNGVPYKIKTKEYTQLKCERDACGQVIIGLGGEGSHESLLSQLTITNPQTSHHNSGPCNDKDATQTVKLRLPSRSTTSNLEPVQEFETPMNTNVEVFDVEGPAYSEPADQSVPAPLSRHGEINESLVNGAEPDSSSNKLDQHANRNRKEASRLFYRIRRRFSKFRLLLKSRSRVMRRKSPTSHQVSAPKTPLTPSKTIPTGLNKPEEILEQGDPEDNKDNRAIQDDHIESVQDEEQAEHSSRAPTLHGPPTLSQQGSAGGNSEVSSRIEDETEPSKPAQYSGESKEEIRRGKRIAKTKEAERQCHCSEACHCMQRSSNGATAGSSIRESIADTREIQPGPWSLINNRQGGQIDINAMIPRNPNIELRLTGGAVFQSRSDAADSIQGSSRSSSWNITHRRQSGGLYLHSALSNEYQFNQTTWADEDARESLNLSNPDFNNQSEPWHPTRTSTGQFSLDSVFQPENGSSLGQVNRSGPDSSPPSPRSSHRFATDGTAARRENTQ